MSGLIEMELVRIRIDEKRGGQVIVLKEKKGKRYLPIVIGIIEASAIKMEVSGFTPPRPLTHDLMNSLIKQLGGKLKGVVVEKLENKIFYAKVMIEKKQGEVIKVDARPSDSIALALRAGAPIFVTETVLNQAEAEG